MTQVAEIWRHRAAVVFVNPAAGAGRAGMRVQRVREVFAAEKIAVEFVATQSVEDLESRARAAIGAGQRLLLSMGGDGTFQGLVNAGFGSDVVLGLLPAGGGNDFATALGLPKDPVAAARSLLLRGRPRVVDVIRARMDGGRQRLCVAGCGLGLDADAMHHASGIYRRWPGRLRYVASALRALRGFQSLGVRVEFPGSKIAAIEAKALTAAALNTPTYGAGLRLAPEARIDDGWLDLTIVKDLSVLQVTAILPGLLTSGRLPAAHVTRVRARRVRLSADRPCFFQGDGEMLGPAPVELEIVPNAIGVLTPHRPIEQNSHRTTE